MVSCEAGLCLGGLSLSGRETTCLAESYHVDGHWVDEVDKGSWSKHSIHEEKSRIVGSPKPWGSVALKYPRAGAEWGSVALLV